MASTEREEDMLGQESTDELPPMEDRTLFLGCLTHIVASSYDFDLTIDGDNNSTKKGDTNSTRELAEEAPPTRELRREEEVSMYFDDDEEQEVIDFAMSAESTDKHAPTENNNTEKKEPHELTAKEEEAKKARNAKIKAKLELAEQRHFVRRYKVAQEFVLNSAKLLFLDESSMSMVQKEFMPQLDVLLEPSQSVKNSNTGTTPKTEMKQILENPEETAKDHAKKEFTSTSSLESLDWVQDNNSLQEYLQKLSDKSAYQCLSCLLFQHLLNAGDKGYDCRVRFWFKTLAVTLWIQHMERTCTTSSDDNGSSNTTQSRLDRATHKFESLESCCADRLLTLAAGAKNAQQPTTASPKRKSLAGNIWKGVQIGGVGLGAGILLAVTGGLAAPGIAVGLSALGLGAVAGTLLTLASHAAVVTLFGVAGGSLAAYKMNRRVSGLTEFVINQELLPSKEEKRKQKEATTTAPKAQLFRTIGVSGWVLDKSDYQRPWGVVPTKPPITDCVELLQRFYYVHNPELVKYAEDIWKNQNKNRAKLWRLLNERYGCDPDHLWAKDKGSMAADYEKGLSKDEIKQLDQIIVAIGNEEGGDKSGKDKSDKEKEGVPTSTTDKAVKPEVTNVEQDGNDNNPMANMLRGWGKPNDDEKAVKPELGTKVEQDGKDNNPVATMLRGWGKPKDDEKEHSSKNVNNALLRGWGQPGDKDFEDVEKDDNDSDDDEPYKPPVHLNTVWDYPTRYGGELYTVQWESALLKELSDSIKDLTLELASSAGQQIAKVTIFSTIVLAAALPLAIVTVMRSIDGTWTLVMDRADQAGKELARSLLVNKGGHRPVTLVGYSFGARIIFVCLKELAQYQQKWEDFQIEKKAREAQGDNPVQGKKNDNKTEGRDVCKVGDLEFDREPASIVEDVVLMGMPRYLNLQVWKACREVVAGRLVNVYSRKDKVLAYIFKYRNLLGSYQPVCGNSTVAVPGVENIDVTDMVSSHQDYSTMVGPILQRVRHGQPVRFSSHALDEVALMEEAETLAKKEAAVEVEGEGEGEGEGTSRKEGEGTSSDRESQQIDDNN